MYTITVYMSIKVSDYIVNFLEKHNNRTIFSITGGFAMHLNDSFGRKDNFEIYYQHHEQACGYAAVGYSKATSRVSVVCTTAGCAATNAISPCLVAHQDSLPVLFLTGQVKSTESIRNMNSDKMVLRHYAGADSDIISMVEPITKYAHEIQSVEEIPEVLSKAMDNLLNGRPGPVWLSVPLDIQGTLMKDPPEIPYIIKNIENDSDNVDYNSILGNVHELLRNSKRPLIIAGNGIKLGNCREKFKKFIEEQNIPVVVTFHGTDLIEDDHELFAGKIGLLGNRWGNFTLQNCDLLISMGCRMAQAVVGYRSDWFAREAKVIYIDNDQNELEKDNISYDLKINMDLNNFFDSYNFEGNENKIWKNTCNHWKQKWYNELPDTSDVNGISPYYFLSKFYTKAPGNKISVCSSGSILTVIWHMTKIKEGDRFVISSQGDMGFEVPAAIGALIAEKEKDVYALLGDGSFQLNLQELQTIKQYNLPLKIVLFNNGAYGAIEITQSGFFGAKFGVDVSSGISFPNTEKIANTYGIKYMSVNKNEEIDENVDKLINYKDGPIILEVFCCIQGRYPRLKAIKNDDGTFSNRPYEDMDPFMSREEFNKEMIVKQV